MRDTIIGVVIDFHPRTLELLASEAIVRCRVPLRGVEITHVRKSLGLTLDAFASALGLTAAAVRKWEVKKTERLHPINEAAVRAFFAEQLKVDLPGKLSQLVGTEKTPKRIAVKTG